MTNEELKARLILMGYTVSHAAYIKDYLKFTLHSNIPAIYFNCNNDYWEIYTNSNTWGEATPNEVWKSL